MSSPVDASVIGSSQVERAACQRPKYGWVVSAALLLRVVGYLGFRPWWFRESEMYPAANLEFQHFLNGGYSPGYAVFLAAIKKFARLHETTSISLWAAYSVTIVQSVLGVLAACVVYSTLRALKLRESVSLAAALFFALLGGTCQGEMAILPESLSLFFLVLGTFLYTKALGSVDQEMGAGWTAALAIVALGLSTLVKAENLVFVAVVIFETAILWLRLRVSAATEQLRVFKRMLPFVVVAAVPLILAWVVWLHSGTARLGDRQTINSIYRGAGAVPSQQQTNSKERSALYRFEENARESFNFNYSQGNYSADPPRSPDGRSIFKHASYWRFVDSLSSLESSFLILCYLITILGGLAGTVLLFVGPTHKHTVLDSSVTPVALGSALTLLAICSGASFHPRYSVPYLGVFVICSAYIANRTISASECLWKHYLERNDSWAWRRRPLPSIIVVYWISVAALFGVALLLILVRAGILRQGYPYNTFLYFPYERFSDLTDNLMRFPYFGQSRFFASEGFIPSGAAQGANLPFAYPPFMAIIFLGVFKLFPTPVPYYTAMMICVAVAFALWFARSLRARGISTLTAVTFSLTALITSYPLIVLLDRGNIEGIVWIASSLGFLAFLREKWWLAATLFALAAAMKMFPVILFALLLSRKRWREFAYALALTGVLTIVALWAIGPTFSFARHGIGQGLTYLHQYYIYKDHPYETGFQHSLFFVIKMIVGWDRVEMFRALYRGYFALCALGGIVLYFWKIRKLPPLNQIIALTTCAVLLPGWSSDYTLVHLYVPWALLVLWVIDERRYLDSSRSRQILWLLVPFAILFTPQSYLLIDIRSIAGQLKGITLVVLLISTIYIPLHREPTGAK